MTLPTDWKFPPCAVSDDHFPAASDEPNALRIRRAKRMCALCPGRLNCLAAAFKPIPSFIVIVIRDDDGKEVDRTMEATLTEDAEGIWGGSTQPERRFAGDLGNILGALCGASEREPLPVVERIRVLCAMFRQQTKGPFAIADPAELVEAV